MSQSSDRLVATIPKNANEEFRVQLRSFKGTRSIDLRVFARNGVEPVATGKGVSIRPVLVRPLIEALQDAERAPIAEGLMTDADR